MRAIKNTNQYVPNVMRLSFSTGTEGHLVIDMDGLSTHFFVSHGHFDFPSTSVKTKVPYFGSSEMLQSIWGRATLKMSLAKK